MKRGLQILKQFTIELDDTIVDFLESIASHLGESIETVIADGAFNLVTNVSEDVRKVFTVGDLGD